MVQEFYLHSLFTNCWQSIFGILSLKESTFQVGFSFQLGHLDKGKDTTCKGGDKMGKPVHRVICEKYVFLRGLSIPPSLTPAFYWTSNICIWEGFSNGTILGNFVLLLLSLSWYLVSIQFTLLAEALIGDLSLQLPLSRSVFLRKGQGHLQSKNNSEKWVEKKFQNAFQGAVFIIKMLVEFT